MILMFDFAEESAL